MFKHIIDEDIELRLLDIYHSEEMFNSINECRAHLKEYMPWVDGTKSPNDTRQFIEGSKRQYADNNGLDAGIWYKDEFAGVIGFHSINRSIKEISIGYWLNKKFVGHGLMTKSCKVLVDYAFDQLQLNRVEIRCAVDNLKSRAIPERLGFIEEGILRDTEFLYDHYVDCVVYSILKRDWKKDSICPLCGQDNNCQHGDEECWCTKLTIPKQIIDMVPEDKKGSACICKQCIEKYS